MKINLKEKEVHILIEQELFDRIKEAVAKNNKIYPKGKNKIKLDYLVYVIDLIEKKSLENKDRLQDGHVRLKAKYFEKYEWNYKRHIDFLKENGFISKIPYSIKKELSYGYKVIYPKNNSSGKEELKTTKYELPNFQLSRKLIKEHTATRIKTESTTGHLTRWLDMAEIEFDYPEAVKYIKSNKSLNELKKHQRRICCEKLKHNHITYNRVGKDNRLHSTFTSLPKDLRPFLKYQEQPLVSLDLKSSQPFFLCALIFTLIERSEEEYAVGGLKPYHVEKIRQLYSVMIRKNLIGPMDTDLREFIDLVLEKDIYSYIGHNLSPDFLSQIKTPFGNINDKYFNLSKGFKEKKSFKNLRDYCKKSMLEYLYCSPKSKEKRILEIRRIMPDPVNMIIDKLKEVNKEHNFFRNDFALILQNIEAFFIVDVITKRIAEERPELFMLTIHDSIVCTLDNMKYVHNTMMDVFIEMLGIVPNIIPEPWFPSSENSIKVPKIA
nr:hypothetical protein [Allomuricauda sp.]